MDEFEKAMYEHGKVFDDHFYEGARWAREWLFKQDTEKWERFAQREVDALKKYHKEEIKNKKLRTENAKLREALEKIVIKPVQDEDYMLVVEEYNPSKIAKQALAETGGDDGEETANQVLWDVLKWLDQGSLSEHDPLYKRIKSVLVEEQK